MIQKISYSIILFIIILSLSQIFILGSNIICMNEATIIISKNVMFNILPFFYIHGCNSSIFYTGIYKKTNRVDIVICNHITNLDFAICSSIIRKFDNRDIYVVYQKEVIYIPYCGSFGSNKDIGLHFNKMEKNINSLTKIINTIECGIIIIMPEGNVSSTKLRKKSDIYCNKNNLHIFRNILYPKTKGLWIICSVLLNRNKMGNIIDMSIVIENFYKKQITIYDLLTKEFGNTFVNINTIEVCDISYNIYSNFKEWFIQKWIHKDSTLNTMLYSKKYIYKKLYPIMNIKYYILIIFLIILFLGLTLYTHGLFIIISTLLSTSMIVYRNIPDIGNLFRFLYDLCFER